MSPLLLPVLTRGSEASSAMLISRCKLTTAGLGPAVPCGGPAGSCCCCPWLPGPRWWREVEGGIKTAGWDAGCAEQHWRL